MPQLRLLTTEEEEALTRRGKPSEDLLKPYIEQLKDFPTGKKAEVGKRGKEAK